MTQSLISDELLGAQLQRASDYLGFTIQIDTWTPGDSDGTRYTIKTEAEGFELSRSLSRIECYEALHFFSWAVC